MKQIYIKTLFVAILLIFATTANAKTYSGKCGINVNYSYNDLFRQLIITGTGAMYDYESRADTPWNSYRSKIIQVKIGNSVTSIGKHAFEGFYDLTSISIPDSVTSIGDYAFYDCSGLTSITIPNSVTTIGIYAFSETKWHDNLPNGIIYINNILYGYIGDMPENTSINVKEGTVSIAGGAFRGCSGLTSVTIPNSVTSIGSSAFYNCIGLERITSLSDTPPVLGANTFYYSNSSQSKPLSEIPVYVFTDVSKYKVSLGWDKFNNYITQIPPFDFTMLNGDDKSIYYRVANSNDLLNQRVSVIKGEEAYRGNINIPDTVNYIGVNFSVTSIGDAAFSESNIIEIGLPQTLEKIGDEAFYGCSRLRNMTYPESLKSIGVSAFEDCVKMTEVVLCENVEKIEAYAFAGCTGLTNVYSLNPVPPVCDVDAFYGIGVEVLPMTLNKAVTNVSLYVPEGSVSAYQAAPEWCNFYNIVASDFVGIEDVEIDANSDMPNAYILGGVLMLTGIYMPTNVAVYNLSGTNVANVMVTPDNCSIDLSNLPKGIYIVAIKGNAHKVIL